jgi:hypothetical protein
MRAPNPLRVLLLALLVASIGGPEQALAQKRPPPQQQALPQAFTESVRPAAKVAEEFFEDVRDANFLQASSKLDRTVLLKFSKARVIAVLRSHQTSVAGFSIDQKFTFAVAASPPQAVSCVEARQANRRKIYLTALLIRRGSEGTPWKVQQFKMTSVPESGCPA